MPICVLAPEVVSRIAAGEVIERPVSVVKELVENSLDAGASQINIEVRGGGINFIRVSDDGVGIPGDEVELAFNRYATSKLTSLADLENTKSLGFRGEALPSIAQVAKVELLTRCQGEVTGTYLSLQNGEVVEKSKRGCPEGTTVTVHGLFRNVPARLKFLKSNATENGHITDLVSQYSLVFPGVRFSLIIDGRRVLQTPGSGNLKDVLVEVYSLEIAQAMLDVGTNVKEGKLGPQITGCISPPSINRTNRSYFSFFVNKRWVQSRILSRAVEKAYEGLLMTGKYPIAIVNLSVPPQWIDVNVHPSKREVKFQQESIIFNTVYGAVRRVLTDRMPIPEVGPVTTPITSPGQTQKETGDIKKNLAFATLIPGAAPSGVPILRVLGQLAATYIIAEGVDGLYLIDQHAAHERVLFEKILAQQEQRGVEIQALLEPLPIELSAKQEELLRARGEILTQFGFDIEPFGGRSYLIRAVPAVLGMEEIMEAVKEAFKSLEDESDSRSGEEKLALSLACHSAVRAGKLLTQEEMRALVQQLERATLPRTCPHGRPTMIHLSSGRLEREFGRS
ncbi:DNA mismatch repair endonuclease MutL [Chloroflexota bacterium]